MGCCSVGSRRLGNICSAAWLLAYAVAAAAVVVGILFDLRWLCAVSFLVSLTSVVLLGFACDRTERAANDRAADFLKGVERYSLHGKAIR